MKELFSRQEAGEPVNLHHKWVHLNLSISTCEYCQTMWFTGDNAKILLTENCPVREYEEGLRVV